jgi:hypothetical protein
MAATVLLAAGVAQAQPTLADYAVLGLQGVTIGKDSRITAGAVGSVGGTVRVRRDAHTGETAAPNVRLAAGARTGNLFCHFVSGPPTLPPCDAFTDPLVDPALLSTIPVTPGTSDLRVPRRTGTAPIAAASFRDVRVGADSLLQLAGGDYSARSLRVGPGGRVVCTAQCRIDVLQPVRLAVGAELGADVSTRADTARVNIAASGSTPAFIARARTNVAATIFAPGGTVVVGKLGSYHGALVGKKVVVAPNATVRGDSALSAARTPRAGGRN